MNVLNERNKQNKRRKIGKNMFVNWSECDCVKIIKLDIVTLEN